MKYYHFSIKIHELTELKETHAVLVLDDEPGVDWLEWSDDGQLLAVATPTGGLPLPLVKCGHIRWWVAPPSRHMWPYLLVGCPSLSSHVATSAGGLPLPLVTCGHTHWWVAPPSRHMWPHLLVGCPSLSSHVATPTGGSPLPLVTCGHTHW